MSIASILLIAAIILFVLAAIGVSSRVSLTDLGLACVAGALMAGL